MSEYKYIFKGEEVSPEELDSYFRRKYNEFREEICAAIDYAANELMSKLISNNLQIWQTEFR